MTRFPPLSIAKNLIAASLIAASLTTFGLTATPALAGGFMFDLPDLTFPQTPAPVTPSTSGQARPSQD